MAVSTLYFFLQACGSPPPENPAPKVVEAYYEALKNKDFDKLVTFYADDFFNNQSKDTWLERLKKRGNLEKVELANMQADTRFSGKFYIFQMHTTYDGKPARETLTLVWGINDKEIKIVAHKLGR
jgi:hypothetical protein